MWRRILMLIAVLAVPLSLIAGPAVQAAVAQGASTAVITPVSGPPGSTVNASGANWTPGDHIQAEWGDDYSNLGSPVMVASDGTFTDSFAIPSNATLGSHQVLFWDQEGQYFEVANFDVTNTSPSPPPTQASPPTHFTVGAISTSAISLTWNRANDDGSGYEVSNGVVSRTVFPSTGSSVSYVWGGLSPNTYMCFRIRTLSSAGASGWVPNGSNDSNYRCAFTPHANSDLLAFPLAGTDAQIGPLGLHDDNFRSIRDDRTGITYSFTGYGNGYNYSLDFLAIPNSSRNVTAVRAGTVLATWAQCHLVVVASGKQWWFYLHVVPSVTSGMSVTRGSVLGKLNAPFPTGCSGETSDWYHVHFVVANQTGPRTAAYATLQNMFFCGHPVRQTATGEIILEGLTIRTNQVFTVPKC